MMNGEPTEQERREQENYVRSLLRFIGEDPEREGLLETPKRVVKAWEEIFHGYRSRPEDFAKVFTSAGDQVVVLRGVEFFSMCEHHMLPFYGIASLGYLPNKKVIGLSKLARIVDCYARRLQIQERMTEEIASALERLIEPKGVAVIIEGVHTCMTMRGVNKQRSRMTTSVMKGRFREDPAARMEILSLLRDRIDHE